MKTKLAFQNNWTNISMSHQEYKLFYEIPNVTGMKAALVHHLLGSWSYQSSQQSEGLRFEPRTKTTTSIATSAIQKAQDTLAQELQETMKSRKQKSNNHSLNVAKPNFPVW